MWSIFDFINPGLLGSAKQFSTYLKSLAERPHSPYGPLRELVRPYILRRLKTDKSVIADLPDKTELKAYCQLSRKQAALYQQAVLELKSRLEDTEGIERKGLVLSALTYVANIAGSIVGSGTVSNRDRKKGAGCLLEKRAEEILKGGKAKTPFLKFGDRVRIEMLGPDGATIFGAIDQQVVCADPAVAKAA